MKNKFITVFSVLFLMLLICLMPSCFALDGDDIIPFEDTNLKSYLVNGMEWDPQYYDKNGDGEISVNEMGQITSIDISTAPTDWEPLKYATALSSITIHDILIVDFFNIEVLANLENLYALSLNNTDLTDVSALNKLTNLKSLSISESDRLTDISCLKDLTNLEHFSMYKTSIEDASVVSNFTKLKSLSLGYNKLKSIPDLSKITAFSDIDVYNQYEEYEIYVNFYNNEITDISGFANTVFSDLYITNNKISDVTPLSTMTNLKSIDLSNNEVTDISKLPKTINTLSLINNKVSDISCLKNFTNLESLFISYNEISGALVLSELENLKSIGISNNKLTSVELKDMPNLLSLSCSNNNIQTFTLENVPNLSDVSLNNNNISDISSLEGLSKVYMFNLSTNPISDISPIASSPARHIYLIDTLVNPYNDATFHIMCTWEENGQRLYLGDYSQFRLQTGTDELGFTYELNADKTAYKITKFENAEIKDLKVPSEYNGLPVTEIAESVFVSKIKLENVILPSNLTSISPYLFQQCVSLKSVTLPENSTSITIYPHAFSGCTKLEKLVVFSNIEEITGGKTTVTLNGETHEIEWQGFYPSVFSCAENFAVHGYTGSYAESYASDNEYKFVAIDAYTTEKTEDVTVGEEKVTVMPTEKKTTVEEILTESKFPVIDTYTIKVLDASGNEKASDAKVGSRNVIQITDEEGTVLAEYTVIVPGDISGDGDIRIFDAFQILKDVLVSFGVELDSIDYMIRDFNEDGNIRIYDAFQYLKEAILG